MRCINAVHNSFRVIEASKNHNFQRRPHQICQDQISPRRTLPLFVPFRIRCSGLVVPSSKSADELQGTEHAKVRQLLLHKITDVAAEWLPPLLDLSRTRCDTVKRVKLSSVRSCAPRASRRPLPIVCERLGTTVETTLISDDAVTFLTDRCQSRRHLPAKRTKCRLCDVCPAAPSPSAMLSLPSTRGRLGQMR